MRQGERSDVIAAAHYLTNLKPDGTVDKSGGGKKFIRSVYAVGYSFGAAVAFAALDHSEDLKVVLHNRLSDWSTLYN